jgi:hypothetical protein
MSTPPTGEPTLLDRFLASIPIAIAVLAVLSLLFWEAAIHKTPTIFTDELEWSQISRSIAATGHAARRGQPIEFKSVYAFLIAPAWWIHSTNTAYTVIKYVNTIVMALVAIPTFLVARTMVSRRAATAAAVASLCTSAFFYAGFLIPESLAYPTFVLCAWVSIRALAGGGRTWIAAAIILDVAATQVRGELVVLPPTLALAAAVLWVVGPSGQRLRRGWGAFEYAGATVFLVTAGIILDRLMSDKSHEWATVTQLWQGRMWSLGMQAASALAIGLGLLPLVGGLAALWIPERRHDPAWRAFAAFAGAAIVTLWTYTAVKAAYLSTVFATRVEERNLIYLGPLLIVGTVVWFRSRRPWLPGGLAALAFTSWLVLYYGYQLDYPYFEAPGYGIAAMANRAWSWDQPTIRVGLAVACLAILVVLAVFWVRRVPARVKHTVLLLAGATTLAWMLAGEITSSRGAAVQSQREADGLARPLDWVDQATGNAGTTFIGQDISSGQSLGVNLLEFWNRSVKNIWSIDGSAPGPGPVETPDLTNRYGALSDDPGLPYVVATPTVNMIGPVVASRPGLTLRRIERHPWRLQEAAYGVSDDGWISGTNENPLVANGTYAYFGPETTPGTLTIDVGRVGFCSHTAPPAHVTLRVGPVALNEQRAPIVTHATRVERFVLPNCLERTFHFTVTPPVAVQVRATPTVLPTDYGRSDNRELGAQVGFSFTPKH